MKIRIQSISFILMAVTGNSFLSAITLQDYPYQPFDTSRYVSDIQQFTGGDIDNPPPAGAILCVGSSSMRIWHNRIQADLDGLTIIPRGFGGSTYKDAIARADDIILAYQPRAVLVYEGDNDIASGHSAERVLEDLQFLVDYCRYRQPGLRFYVISIKPSIARRNKLEEMKAANALMRDYCGRTEGLTFIDIATPLSKQDGTPRSDVVREDNLHLNSKGYDIWARSIRNVLIPAEAENEDEVHVTGSLLTEPDNVLCRTADESTPLTESEK